jgi:hypothetical protein
MTMAFETKPNKKKTRFTLYFIIALLLVQCSSSITRIQNQFRILFSRIYLFIKTHNVSLHWMKDRTREGENKQQSEKKKKVHRHIAPKFQWNLLIRFPNTAFSFRIRKSRFRHDFGKRNPIAIPKVVLVAKLSYLITKSSKYM